MRCSCITLFANSIRCPAPGTSPRGKRFTTPTLVLGNLFCRVHIRDPNPFATSTMVLRVSGVRVNRSFVPAIMVTVLGGARGLYCLTASSRVRVVAPPNPITCVRGSDSPLAKESPITKFRAYQPSSSACGVPWGVLSFMRRLPFLEFTVTDSIALWRRLVKLSGLADVYYVLIYIYTF